MARVLLVDDDATIRRSLSVMLTRAGFEVHTAEDGALAIQLGRQLMPDLVICDYNMPTGGLAVVRYFKSAEGSAVYVAVLTGDDDDETREECFSAGADAVLAKPISSADLRQRLSVAAASLKAVAVAS
jgi:CheY-like chemotaxis protein